MAKQIDNSYTGNVDFTDGLSRTNPQAHLPNNAIQLYGIRKIGDCSFAPTWTWAVTNAGDDLTFTPTAGDDTEGLRFWKYKIIDEDGNEAFGTMNVASPAAVAVDTSGLDPLKAWRIEFMAGVTAGGQTCEAEWWIKLPAGSVLDNPTGSGQDI